MALVVESYYRIPRRSKDLSQYNNCSDLDPDPVGSAFIWVRESGSRGYEIKEKSKNSSPA